MVPDAPRLAPKKASPFELLTPNETTIAAMNNARAGKVKRSAARRSISCHRGASTDEPLKPRYRHHALTGDWRDHRYCHLKPDVVLIDRKPDDDTLQLVRLGSHAELASRRHARREAPVYRTTVHF